MVDQAFFRLKLTGDTADEHEFEAYDGYMALAGFARTLNLVTNYVEEGKIRQRGDFAGRRAVRATALESGSLIADFFVNLNSTPADTFKIGGLTSATALLTGLVQRVIGRNVGGDEGAQNPATTPLIARKNGDVEALVAIAETPIRQTHSVIGNGASQIEIIGGHNLIGTLNADTRDYVNMNIDDPEERRMVVSVAAFNVNSGYGSVFDFDLGRTVPISMSREGLRRMSVVFTWGLDQYSNQTGEYITISYTRVLAMDGSPKRYVILNAIRGR